MPIGAARSTASRTGQWLIRHESRREHLATDLIHPLAFPYLHCKPEGLHSYRSAPARNDAGNKYCENRHCFVKKKRERERESGCAPPVTSIFHFAGVIINGFASPSALSQTGLLLFASLPRYRCAEFFIPASKCCLRAKRESARHGWKTNCRGYPCRKGMQGGCRGSAGLFPSVAQLSPRGSHRFGDVCAERATDHEEHSPWRLPLRL